MLSFDNNVRFHCPADWFYSLNFTLTDPMISSNTNLVINEYETINEQWPGLTVHLLLDIFGVHKALMFGQFQRMDFSFSEFTESVENAERTLFNGNEYSRAVAKHHKLFQLSFYPLYLVADDVFQVMSCHFAVSFMVNLIANEYKDANDMRLRSVVIPNGLCSRYDTNDEYQPNVPLMEKYLKRVSSSKFQIYHVFQSGVDNVIGMAQELMQCVESMKGSHLNNFVIVFDRRNMENAEPVSVWIFVCSQWSQLSDLERNYFISFEFRISCYEDTNEDGTIVRSWLTFGVAQRLRFYPEYVVWIIPHLFVRATTTTTYKMVQALYDESYKHGWRVSLDDEEFNEYYHIITGYRHVSNNYNRDAVPEPSIYEQYGEKDCGLRDHLNRKWKKFKSCKAADSGNFITKQSFDSDSILLDTLNESNDISAKWSNIAGKGAFGSLDLLRLQYELLQFSNDDCTANNVHKLSECLHVELTIRNLLKFEECGRELQASNLHEFDLEQIIHSFDHLITVHKFYFDQNTKGALQQHVAHRVECAHGAQCQILKRYCSRTRERHDPEDIEIDSDVDILTDTLHSVHCYVLHREEDISRLLSRRNQKFLSYLTAADDDNQNIIDDEQPNFSDHVSAPRMETPPEINFGLNVLQWLPYGETPFFDSLKAEMTKRKEMNIEPAIWINFLVVCAAKIMNTNYTVDEALCLKFYTDTNDLQAALRRAHWTATKLEVRKSFYQWAIGLYRTHLYHAKPIPAALGSTSTPTRLFHGLDQLFTVDNEMLSFL